MGNLNSIRRINFEDMQKAIKNEYLIINTLPLDMQHCLIINSVEASLEEEKINSCIKMGRDANIIIYGKNANDEKIYMKYKQLYAFGFKNIYIYIGGLFEWLLLQDIYGNEEFPTTKIEPDMLKYRPNSIL